MIAKHSTLVLTMLATVEARNLPEDFLTCNLGRVKYYDIVLTFLDNKCSADLGVVTDVDGCA